MTGLALLAFILATVAAARGMWSPCGLSMLSSLNPVSERARGHRFGWTAAWHVVGAVAGGSALGAVCAAGATVWGSLHVPAGATWCVAAALAALGALSDWPAVPWSLPAHPRQVDEQWLRAYRRWIYAAGFGAQIGAGFATYVMTAGVYVVTGLAMLTGSASTALLVGVSFGAARGLCVLATARVSTAAGLRSLVAAVERRGPASVAALIFAQTAAACVAVGAAIDGMAAASVVIAAALALAAGARVVSRAPTLISGAADVGRPR